MCLNCKENATECTYPNIELKLLIYFYPYFCVLVNWPHVNANMFLQSFTQGKKSFFEPTYTKNDFFPCGHLHKAIYSLKWIALKCLNTGTRLRMLKHANLPMRAWTKAEPVRSVHMDSSTTFQAPPKRHILFDLVIRFITNTKHAFLYFLGQIVSCQYNPNLLA